MKKTSLTIFILIIIVLLYILFNDNITFNGVNKVEKSNSIEVNGTSNTEINTSQIDSDEITYNDSSEYRESTYINIMKNYYEKENEDENFDFTDYCQYGYEGVINDIAVLQVVESNYKQYESKENNIKKYDKAIDIDIANISEDSLDFNKSLDEMIKKQVTSGMNETGVKIGRKGYYGLTGMLIINGNDESEEKWKEHARAKNIKITIDGKKEIKYQLEDKYEPQLIDIDYKNKSLDKPINIKIEVIDYFSGEKTNDVYISDLKFGTIQSF